MSAIEVLMGRGMATMGGDFSQDERNVCNEFIKKFGNKVQELGKTNLIPASQITLLRMSHLLIVKDIVSYHIAFVDKPGNNLITYRDLSKMGFISVQILIQQVKLEIGEVHWVLSIPTTLIETISEEKIKEFATLYIEAILQAVKKQADNKISDEAISIPELSKYIEAFTNDYPKAQKTAFIIMQFSKTKAHEEIVQTIKSTLKKHNIIGLRVDDKEYSDDLFQNIRTYMHCTDFGISVFERILEDTFNPNVSLEVGYMLGLGKSVCFLKDNTLQQLHSDLVGKLYKPFDPQDILPTLPLQLEKWMKDKGLV